MCYRCDQARSDCIGMIRETARAFMRAKANGASASLVAQRKRANLILQGRADEAATRGDSK